MQASKQYTCKNGKITEVNPYIWHNSEERHLTYEEQGENMSWVMFEENIKTYDAPGVPDGVYSEGQLIFPWQKKQKHTSDDCWENCPPDLTDMDVELLQGKGYELRQIARLKAQTEPEKQEEGAFVPMCKKGDHVKLHDCIEADYCQDTVFTVREDSYIIPEGYSNAGAEAVFLVERPGYFLTQYIYHVPASIPEPIEKGKVKCSHLTATVNLTTGVHRCTECHKTWMDELPANNPVSQEGEQRLPDNMIARKVWADNGNNPDNYSRAVYDAMKDYKRLSKPPEENQVRELSGITKEECLEVLKLANMGSKAEEHEQFFDLLREQGDFMGYFFNVRPLFFNEALAIYRYLSSKGYKL